MYPKLSSNPKSYVLSALDGGIVIDEKETRINENCSPDMLNMIFDGNVLKKREGQEVLFSDNDGIIACYEGSFYNYIIYHSKDKIKAYNLETKEITVLEVRLSEKAGVFFTYNGYVYYLGAKSFFKISHTDGELSCAEVEGYIPTVLVNCESSGIGDKYEEFNFLTGGFKISYNTAGDKNITIPYAPLDESKKIIIKWGDYAYAESTYTVNYETGLVTFRDTLNEGHNLLEITAYTKEKEDREKITGCTIYEIFGGINSGSSDGTRVFLSGNSDYANTFFYSGLKNPEYFPVNQFDILGDTFDPITCMGKQYNSLVFLKEKSAYISYYTYDGDMVNFTISQISAHIGCDCPKSLVSIDNQLTWLNSIYGVMTLSSTSIKDEKNIRCISSNINGTVSEKALLNQQDLRGTVGFINRGKYYLVTGKYTYVLNMKKSFSIGISPQNMHWFIFDNIRAKDCLFIDKEAYLLSDRGITYFKNVLYDFDADTPINAYVCTKAVDFNAPGHFKYIGEISFYMATINNSFVEISFTDENGEIKKSYEYELSKFNFINFSFNTFTFYSNLFSFFIKRKVLRRRCMFFKVTFKNFEKNSQMAISDIIINYFLERGARYNGI